MSQTLSRARTARPLPDLPSRQAAPEVPGPARFLSGQSGHSKRPSLGGWLLHIDGSSCQIEGRVQRDRQKRFVPLRPQDLQPVRSLIASGLAVIGAVERLTRLGRRTNRFTPVLGLKLDQDGSVLLREVVLVG